MRFHASPRTTLAAAALVTGALSLSACSAGSLGSSDDESGKTTISFLTNNDPNNVKIAEAVVKAFEAANDDIDVKVDTRPGGGDGDNLVKTKLSTGDMAEVFEYNSGSLFQAIAPTTNLTPVTDEPWVADLDETFASVVSAEEQVYGAPWGNITGGGIFYNIPVYEKLGLEVPQTWDEFIANNEKIKAEGGIAPVEQTFGDTWTTQILVLANNHNVTVADPNFAEDYTANKAKFSTTPAALAGFEHLQELNEAGLLNEDFASDLFTDGLTAVATGEAAHYPMITFGIPAISGVAPDNVNDVGFFALRATTPPATARPCGTRRASTSPRAWRATSSRPPRSSRPSSPRRTAATPRLSAAPVGGPWAVDDVRAPGRRADGGQRRAGVRRRRPVDPGAGVPLPDQGPCSRADPGRGRVRHPSREGRRRALRQGRREAGPAARSAGLVDQPLEPGSRTRLVTRSRATGPEG